jgi:carbon monoxide dehydrogenase subunit G
VIEVHERFDVASPPDRVWAVLSDPYAIVGCVPGASINGQNDDGSLDASVGVKFGPTRVSFKVRAMLDLDEAARTGKVTGQGRDSIGGTRMRSTATFAVTPGPAGDGSHVEVDGQVEVQGRLASLIEGGATVIVKRMAGEFADRLAARCAQQSA